MVVAEARPRVRFGVDKDDSRVSEDGVWEGAARVAINEAGNGSELLSDFSKLKEVVVLESRNFSFRNQLESCILDFVDERCFVCANMVDCPLSGNARDSFKVDNNHATAFAKCTMNGPHGVTGEFKMVIDIADECHIHAVRR